MIHEGEKFCPFENEFGMICSNKFDREHIFTMHVESCRGDVAQHRPMSKYREHLEMKLNPNELALADSKLLRFPNVQFAADQLL